MFDDIFAVGPDDTQVFVPEARPATEARLRAMARMIAKGPDYNLEDEGEYFDLVTAAGKLSQQDQCRLHAMVQDLKSEEH